MLILEIATKTICSLDPHLRNWFLYIIMLIMNLIPGRRFKQVATRATKYCEKAPENTCSEDSLVTGDSIVIRCEIDPRKGSGVHKQGQHTLRNTWRFGFTVTSWQKFVWQWLRSVFNFRFTQFHNFFGLRVCWNTKTTTMWLSGKRQNTKDLYSLLLLPEISPACYRRRNT